MVAPRARPRQRHRSAPERSTHWQPLTADPARARRPPPPCKLGARGPLLRVLCSSFPRFGPCRLDACAIAGILTESLTSWDDPALAALNPTAQLPAQPITLVYLNLSMPITERLT